MKGSVALVLVAGLLILSLLFLAHSVSSADSHTVYVSVPEGEYDLGSVVTVEITVFENGGFKDPDFLNFTVEQYDETRRAVNVTRTGEGRYTGEIILRLSDINAWGTVHIHAHVLFGTDSVGEGSYFHTVYQDAPRADIVLTDPDDVVARPGQDIEFELKVTFLGEAIDPDPGSLIAVIHEEADNGSEWYSQIPLTRISTGRYNGTFHIPPGGTESTTYYVYAGLNCTVDGRIWTKYLFGNVRLSIPITYYRIWSHYENVTRESADLTLYFEDTQGIAASDASVHLNYSYYRDIQPSPLSITMIETTDGNGLLHLHMSYPDIGESKKWFDVEGTIDKSGYRQHFWGRVQIPPPPPDYPYMYDGIRVTILTEELIPANEEVTISLYVTMDREPISGYEVFVYMMTQNEFLFNGALVTDDDGFINFTIRTKNDNINMVYYYWLDYIDEPRYMERNHWFIIDGSSAYGQYFLDAETTISVDPFPPGGPIEVTFDNPDADGVAEMAGVIWAVGDLSDYRDDDFYPPWRSWRPYGSGLYPYISGNTVIASWDGEMYRASIILPPFLPDDVRLFVMGLIEFKDSPYQDIRGALLENLTATLPHARPLVNISTPVDEELYHGRVEVSGTASAVTSLRRVVLRVEGGKWLNAFGTNIWNLTLMSENLQTGANTIEVRAFDGEIWSKTVSVTFTFDKTPRVWIDIPTDASRNEGLLIAEGRALDDISLEQVEVRVDSGEWFVTEGSSGWTHEIDTRSLEFGHHTLDARAFDGFTYSTVVTRSFFADQRPTLLITSPSEGEYIHGPTTAEGLSADDGGAPYVEIRFDGGPWTIIVTANRWNLTIDPEVLGSGPHNLKARAFDGYLYSPIAAVNFTVDLPPSIRIISPLEGSHVPVPVNLSGWTSDDLGVVSVFVRIDGGDWLTAMGTEDWYLALDPLILKSGEHVVEARSFDSISFSGITSRTFQLDTRPSVEISIPGSGDILGRRVEVKGTVMDDFDNVSMVQVRIDGGEWIAVEYTGGWGYEVVLAEGEHFIEARCTDGLQLSDIERVEFLVEEKEVADNGVYLVLLLIIILSSLVLIYSWQRHRSREET